MTDATLTPALALAFIGFAFVTSITPGPNNAMLLASGLNFGFRRTLPHLAGVSLGCIAMMILVGLGLGEVFHSAPMLYRLLRIAGAIYLLRLAWKIAFAAPIVPGTAAGRPIGFVQAAAFQWVNPKAWVMVVGAVTTYAPHHHFMRGVATLAILLGLVGAPCIMLWAGGGVALRRVLNNPARIRAFNVSMALLLVLSLYPILRA